MPLQLIAALALAAYCVLQTWHRGGTDAALAVGLGCALLLAMILWSRRFAAVLRRRGSPLTGLPQAHAVEPAIFVVLGWGLLAFIAWVASNGE